MIILISSLLLFCMCLGNQSQGDAPKAPDRSAHGITASTHRETASAQSPQPGVTRASEQETPSTTVPSAKGCDKCSDGTACGDYSPNGVNMRACICDIPWGDGNFGSCYLSSGRLCTACTDGTPCGENNAKGELCSCWEKVKGGKYIQCFLPYTSSG